MGILSTISDILPEVRRPHKSLGLQEKLLWTAGALVLFFILGQVYPVGVDTANLVVFQRLELLLGSRIGTLITAGIGPIVLASIFLQLAVGAGLLNLDTSTTQGKKDFQGLQKLLSIGLSFLEAFIYTFTGYIGVNAAAPLLGSILAAKILVGLQIAIGSIILLYLDEVVQKYGIGSGISLFIAANVCQAVFLGAFSIAGTGTGAVTGLIPTAIQTAANGDLVGALWYLPPVIFTAVVFLAVVYVEGMRIELPLAYGRARGLGARYPIKFLYVSNIPVILASAVILNIQLIGLFLWRANIFILGQYVNNQPVSGLAYLTSALNSPITLGGGNYQAYLAYLLTPTEILHAFTYGITLVVLSIVFGWFWIESTGASAHDVSKQLEGVGLQIPGFRADPRVIESVLSRYIPIITLLGSAFVGILAWFADITGALGTGTGILLTVGILYRFYEDLAQQQLFEIYPSLKNLVKV